MPAGDGSVPASGVRTGGWCGRRGGAPRFILIAALHCLRILGGLEILAAGGAAAANAPEYDVKAAFLYNFARFAVWPASAFAGADTPVALCVAGGNPFGAALGALQGKPVGDRRVEVREVPVERIDGCHILYLARPVQGRVAEVTGGPAGRYVLTVGDSDGFAAHGGAVNLLVEDDRVRFEVNLAALKRSGVTLSSHVLRLARIVEEGP